MAAFEIQLIQRATRFLQQYNTQQHKKRPFEVAVSVGRCRACWVGVLTRRGFCETCTFRCTPSTPPHPPTHTQCALKERVRYPSVWWPRHTDLMAKIFRELRPPVRPGAGDTYMSALCYISAQYRAYIHCSTFNICIHRQTPHERPHHTHTHTRRYVRTLSVCACVRACLYFFIHRECLLRVQADAVPCARPQHHDIYLSVPAKRGMTEAGEKGW